MWFDHLNTIQENRKKGAIKAAESRRQKKKATPTSKTKTAGTRESDYQCGVCSIPYQEFTGTSEQWIGCDKCDTWYHFTCIGISVAPAVFLCRECDQRSEVINLYNVNQ